MSTVDDDALHHPADQHGRSAVPGQRRLKSGRRILRFERLFFFLFPTRQAHKPAAAPPASSPPIIELQASTPPRPRTVPNASSAALVTAAASAIDMPHSHEHPLDIVLHDEAAVLRGIGVDVASATIRGFVRLYLQEATDIKTIIIRCTGKSRVALVQKDGSHTQPHTIIHYLKEVDLLEGDKTHPHTIKAGVHDFPFSFELDGSLPASINANFDLAAIEYKLRAIAVRPSFSHNFTMLKDVTVVRSFSPESLEFQQTLEIENSWPEKIQYAVILPHKAWAAGDHISAVLKFIPLAKGVKVVNVRMGLQEKVKTVWKSSIHEEVRVVCSKKQKLAHGRPSPRRSPSPTEEPPSANAETNRRPGTSSFFRRVGSRVQSRENLLGIFRTRTGGDDTPPSAPNSPPPRRLSSGSESSYLRAASPQGSDGENEDVEMIMRMRIPTDATPSHNIGPVFVSHRIKWDVLISNLDGHFSELRCSLPIHLLAKEVLEETLAATNATRTALLGEDHGVQVQEVILPAYHDHIRDRVAIAGLTEHALATNPLNAMSTPATPEANLVASLPSSYGASSNMPAQIASSAVPRVTSLPDASERGRLRGSRAATALPDPHASELYLSLGRRPDTANSQGAEGGSHPPSQSSSRASSPDRMGDGSGSSRASRHAFSIRPLTSVFKSKASSSASSSNPNSRPGSSHKKHRATFSRSSSGISAPSSPEAIPPLPLPRSRGSNSPTSTQTSAATSATTNSTVEYYYDAVPSYAFAAQGFLGGGITPLTSLRGLPSYNEAQRSRTGSPQTSTVNSAASQDSSSSGGSRRRSGTRSSFLLGRSSSEQPSRIPEDTQS